MGIGWAVARRLAGDGWRLSLTGWPDHDAEQPWGRDPFVPNLPGATWQAADLSDPLVPGRLVEDHLQRYGSLDALVACKRRHERRCAASCCSPPGSIRHRCRLNSRTR